MKINSSLFFHPQLSQDQLVVSLAEETRKHVATVLRMQVGDSFVLTNGEGLMAKATILSIEKKNVEVSLSHFENQTAHSPRISLGIGLLKNTTRFEWMLEKVTELGVHEIFPLITERTERQHFRKERFEQIIRSASLQSEQTIFPLLHDPQAIHVFLNLDLPSTRFIAHCRDTEKKPLTKQHEDCIVLIGPEGDFTDIEIDLALKKKFEAASLGETRLRTETAGVISVALMRG